MCLEPGIFAHHLASGPCCVYEERNLGICFQALASASIGDSFRQANQTLEVVQAQLTAYLSSKRVAWPRFHFISDGELVDILSNATRDVSTIQRHIPQLFEGASSLNLEGAGSGRDVVAMVSAAGEELQLTRPIKARGMPEGWLSSVEAAMRTHLCNAVKQSFRSVLAQTSPADRCTWIPQTLNQIALLSFNLQWTSDVNNALSVSEASGAESDKPPSISTRLEIVLNECISFIQYLSSHMTQRISSLHRQAFNSTMVTVVHHRDVVTRLHTSRVSSPLDFLWLSQLRCASCPRDNLPQF